MTTQWVSEHVRQHQQKLEELYQHLHRNPELSMQEAETMAELTRRLESFGYETHQIGGGVVGVLANGEGPTVLFRADVDALPVQEATGLPYASTRTMADRSGATVPAMHACGHDMHAAAGIGAAGALAAHRDAWAGTYLALFQPGEETAEGAEAMVADGLASRVPKPDVVLGQHVLTTPGAGMVATRPGPILSTGGSLRVILRGRGSHGSMPHLGVGPSCSPHPSFSGCRPSSPGRWIRSRWQWSPSVPSRPARRPTSSRTTRRCCSTCAPTPTRSATT